MIVVYTKGEGMLYLDADVYKYDNNTGFIIIDTKDTGKHIIPTTEITRIQIRQSKDNSKEPKKFDISYKDVYEIYRRYWGLDETVKHRYEPAPEYGPYTIRVFEGSKNCVFAVNNSLEPIYLFFESTNS